MRHDEIAADLARKLEKATELQPGPAYLDNPIDLSRVVTQPRRAVTLGLAECICETEARCYVSLRNAAPLLLSERAALRRLEDAVRKALEPSGLMETSLSRRNERIERVKAALRALDAAREEA